MSGRGGRGGARGRGGRAQGTLNLDAMGINRESMPTPVQAPPPLYPRLPHGCQSIRCEEEDEALLHLKRSTVSWTQGSRFHVKGPIKGRGIERYSDKYTRLNAANAVAASTATKWDMRLFPAELDDETKSKDKIKKRKTLSAKEKSLLTLEQLEQLEKETEKEATGVDGKEKNKSDEEDSDEAELEEGDDDDLEEDNDYATTYFDNGEAFDDGDDEGNDNEPTYN